MTTLITPGIQEYFNGNAMIYLYHTERTSKFAAELGTFRDLNGSIR